MCQVMSERGERISVLIVEDHHIFREALVGYLETQRDRFEVAGEVATREEALQLVQERLPDIVLLDLALPDNTEAGVSAIQEIHALSPSTQIVVLTSYRDNETVFRAIQAGAVSYLLKDHVRGKDVIDSLLRVHEGDPLIDPEIARKLWTFFQSPSASVAGQSPLEQLTPRELQVLELIAAGKSNQEIAENLVITTNTVKKHVSNILSKLQLQNRIELALYYRAEQRQLDIPAYTHTPR